jgi:hypothetical protein
MIDKNAYLQDVIEYINTNLSTSEEMLAFKSSLVAKVEAYLDLARQEVARLETLAVAQPPATDDFVREAQVGHDEYVEIANELPLSARLWLVLTCRKVVHDRQRGFQTVFSPPHLLFLLVFGTIGLILEEKTIKHLIKRK